MKLFSLLLCLSLHAAPSPQVVLTYPLETDLEISGAKDTQKVWLDMIQKATRTLDIEQFYVSDEKGQALEPVLEAIRKAAGRGVKVRLLVDEKFFKTYPDTVKELGTLTNIETKTIDYAAVAGGVQHAKFLVVDGKDMYVGSANFDWRALSHIHEVGLRVVDETLGRNLLRVFSKDWGKGAPETVGIFSAGNSGIELWASPSGYLPSGVGFSFDRLRDLIEGAQRSLKVQVYEYSTKVYGSKETWPVLQHLIIQAAKRGVKVELVVDATALTKAKADLELLAKEKNIQVRTVKIPKFSGGEIDYARLIHSKYLLVDGTTYWVGTDNWSKGYFYNSRGVGLVGDDTSTFAILEQIFEKVKASSYATLVK
jgi:phosphatidylserine/phosphatidylglycerophosphate/cardiolipin synthase-like enzyme